MTIYFPMKYKRYWVLIMDYCAALSTKCQIGIDYQFTTKSFMYMTNEKYATKTIKGWIFDLIDIVERMDP